MQQQREDQVDQLQPLDELYWRDEILQLSLIHI